MPLRWSAPTASGKTAAALALAHQLQSQGGAEIISMDSALVYRGMEIGTAKPSREELATVPHHLIDTLDPLQSYSAAEFAKDATRLIHDIRARGKTPLLVGGTMLYLKALLEGLNDIPAANPEIRAQIQEEAERIGWPALHARLAQVDPQTAARLAPGDSQRIGRALEVWTATGQTLTSFHQSAKAQAPDWHIPIISLEPQDRAWLHQRIALRFEQMMAAGFMDEVKALRARGDLNLDLPSMRCVGYRQAWEGLDSHWPEPRSWSAASLPRANWPSGKSPGCAACPIVWWRRPMHPMPCSKSCRPPKPICANPRRLCAVCF